MLFKHERVAVLGAGTMGSQIAAHFANAGIPTLLLDLPAETPGQGGLAEAARRKLPHLQPPPLYSEERLQWIETGVFEADYHRLKDCSWIIEAVVEDLEVKRRLWEAVDAHRVPGTIVSTNTSGIPVGLLAEDRSRDFRRHWLGTHFFNPPRYMKLLELIAGPETLQSVLQTVEFVGNRILGKGTVRAKDRPNFIANRIGCFVSQRAFQLMQQLELTIEEVDALTGPLIGRPKTGTFRLADLVGLDVLVQVTGNLHGRLTEDPWRERFEVPAPLREMVRLGLLGDKAGRGFYKKEQGELFTLDLGGFEYRPFRRPHFPSLQTAREVPELPRRISRLLNGDDRVSAFLWPFLRDTLAYSAACVPEITGEYFEIDRAMKWGFNWELGPFELWQELGVREMKNRIESDGIELPDWVVGLDRHSKSSFYAVGVDHELFYDLSTQDLQILPEAPDQLRIALLRKLDCVVRTNPGASLLDLGEGVAGLEFHSKMNVIGGDLIELAQESLSIVEKNFLGLVIGNQGPDFSVGANLMLLLLEAQNENWEEIEAMVRSFQQMNLAFRRFGRPVVAAPFRRTLGGGAEICLGCDSIVASAETYMGLVETGVGLIPAGGGTKEMLFRHLEGLTGYPDVDPLPALRSAFETIGLAHVSRSGEEARKLRFLASGDEIEIHPDRLLFAARRKVLALTEAGYAAPPRRERIPALGDAALAALKVGIHLMRRSGTISDHDALVGRKLAYVLTGGNLNHPTFVDEEYFLDLEREAFLSLCGEHKTQERIQHTLKTGKPLRN